MNSPATLILGAGYAGQMAAARIAKRRPDARLTVVDASPVFVERIRLHQIAAGGRLKARPMPDVLPRGARFVQGRVTAWDVATKQVTVTTPDGQSMELPYDWCVHALGSRIDTTVPGVARHAHTLDDPAGAARAAAMITPGAKILIVGAGLTGIEAATELAERRRDVAITLVASGALGAELSPAGAQHVRDVLARSGVTIRERTRIRNLEPSTAITDGDPIPFDVCLWNGGFIANPLAREAGLSVNAKNQVRVDATLRVPDHPEIFVAGDAADVAGPDREPLRMACATAMPMGTYVGEAVAKAIENQAIKPFRFAYKIRCISLGRRNGLIQHVDEADRPVPQVWTGRVAAVIKEVVCRSTVMAIRGEGRLRIPFYRWPQPTNQTAPLPEPAAVGD